MLRHRGVGSVDGLDEIVHVVRHGYDARAAEHPVQGGRAHEHVLLAIDRLGAGLHRRVVGVGRGQPVDIAGRTRQPGGARSLVAMQAPHALENQIDGSQVGHQQVEVDIE